MNDLAKQTPPSGDAQTLYVVYGGRVEDPAGNQFVDPSTLDIRGIFDDYDGAYDAWRAASQHHVDNAFIKYVIRSLS
jgi:hypothetical protein